MKNFLTNLFKNTSTKVEDNRLNLREYYWTVDDFIEPQVRVYQITTDEYETEVYCLFEKIDETRLKITNYREGFVKSLEVIQVFKKDGVYIESFEFGTLNKPEEKIETVRLEAFIFPFLDVNAIMKEEHVYKDYADIGPVIVKAYKTRSFTNHKEDNPIILKSKGRTEKSIYMPDNFKLMSFYNKIEHHFKKGVGEVFRGHTFKGGYSNMSYKKTISVKVFEALKNSKTNV